MKRIATVDVNLCVACGACAKVCPRKAISIFKGIHARVERDKCIGCGLCARTCPASVIMVVNIDE